jgi:hypothetical protein
MPSRGRGSHAGKGGRSANQTNSSVLSGEQTKNLLEIRESNSEVLSKFIQTQPHLKHVNDTITLYKEIVPVKLRGKNITLNTGITLLDWKPDSVLTPNIGTLTIQEGSSEQKEIKAYQKTIALLDPYHWMRYGEMIDEPFSWISQNPSVLAPENQGYIDTIASALVSKLHITLHSPHFCKFYGTFRAVTDTYMYNLEDDLEDFRFTNWFWKALDIGRFELCVIEKNTGKQLNTEEVKEFLKPDDVYLQDDTSDDEDDSDDDNSDDSDASESLSADFSLSADSIDELPNTLNETIACDMEEITSFDACVEEISFDKIPAHSHTKTKSSYQSSSSSNISFTDDYTVHAKFKSMPVVYMYLEKLSGTMDELLENNTLTPIQTPEQETQWSAWLFQICVALTQLQTILKLTHNDLHTNNIVWKPTDNEFLWYKDSKGRVWKVPTYGKLFSIIDYGRAIFTIQSHICISSDYDDGHDASGMYNFGPIENKDYPRVMPNKSFDLCRLSCSLLRALYPKNPDSIPKTQVLTRDGSWEVRETAHTLFNMLWIWLKTKDGKNVLETESGKERFPGFELYSVIAAQVKDAIPENQFNSAAFKKFLLPTNSVLSTTVECIPF